MELPSQFQIGGQVEFLVSEKMALWGEVVGVRFTKGKVFYDIIDDTAAYVHRDIDSCDVKPMKDALTAVAQKD